jgi:hypothetical protein
MYIEYIGVLPGPKNQQKFVPEKSYYETSECYVYKVDYWTCECSNWMVVRFIYAPRVFDYYERRRHIDTTEVYVIQTDLASRL